MLALGNIQYPLPGNRLSSPLEKLMGSSWCRRRSRRVIAAALEKVEKEDSVHDELATGASFTEARRPHGELCTQETCSGCASTISVTGEKRCPSASYRSKSSSVRRKASVVPETLTVRGLGTSRSR
jgi:hypothetical protein